MKIQDLAIIFVVIIMPIAIILSAYTNFQIKTLNTQIAYDRKLTSATYDAIKAFQLNTTNSSTSDLSESKIRDIEASIEVFKASASSAFGFEGSDVNDFNDYMPALVYTMYDGFYIYSPYTNTNYLYEYYKDEDGNYIKPDGSSSKEPIQNENKPLDQNGEILYGLKPYITYSMRYVSGDYDVVITYALDNYITIQGTANGKYINDSGYVISGITKESGELKYKGIKIDTEGELKEWVGTKEYPYIKINGTKYYYDNNNTSEQSDDRIFYVSNNGIKVQGNFLGEKAVSFYKQYIKNNKSAYNYYYKSYEFMHRNEELMNSLKTDDIDIKDEDGNSILLDGGIGLFDGDIEYKLSNFNQHRLAVIRYVIEKNLSVAISNYNLYSNEVQFQMPNLSETEWDRIINNISLISFVQGINIGGKIYNGYAIVNNTESKEVVQEDDIYIIGKDDNMYHKISDEELEVENISALGRLHLDFNRKIVQDIGTYYPLRELASYSSIVQQKNVATYDDIYKYVENKDTLRSIFYTALGREREGMYRRSKEVQTFETYTIKLDSNTIDAVVMPVDSIEYIYIGTSIDLSKYGEPTRTGYDFEGWYTKKEDGDKVEEIGNINNSQTLYAHWKESRFDVIYYRNGGYDGPANQIKYYFTDLKLATKEAARVGYDFVNWNTKADGTGTTYYPGTIYDKNEPLKLYAQWKVNKYTVIFNANNGSVSPTTKQVTFDTQYGELPTPTRTGYTFAGWWLDATNITAATTVKTGENHTLIAHWTPNVYTLYFNANGGTVEYGSKQITYDAKYGSLPTPTKTGYNFVGWYTAGGVQITSETIVKTPYNDVLYAWWIPLTPTVIFNGNGGTVGYGYKQVTYDGTYGALPAASRPGYIFLGWFTSTSGGMQVTSGTTVKIPYNHTLHAQWRQLMSRSVYIPTYYEYFPWDGNYTKDGTTRYSGAVDVGNPYASVTYSIGSYIAANAGYLDTYLQGSNDGYSFVTIGYFGKMYNYMEAGQPPAYGSYGGTVSGYRYYRICISPYSNMNNSTICYNASATFTY